MQSTSSTAANKMLLALGAVMLMGKVVCLIAALKTVEQRPF